MTYDVIRGGIQRYMTSSGEEYSVSNDVNRGKRRQIKSSGEQRRVKLVFGMVIFRRPGGSIGVGVWLTLAPVA